MFETGFVLGGVFWAKKLGQFPSLCQTQWPRSVATDCQRRNAIKSQHYAAIAAAAAEAVVAATATADAAATAPWPHVTGLFDSNAPEAGHFLFLQARNTSQQDVLAGLGRPSKQAFGSEACTETLRQSRRWSS